MTLDPDSLHRGVKLEMDSGKAKDREDAERIVRSYVLQIRVGGGLEYSQTRQAALLTAVNAGSRAFLGAIRVQIDDDFTLTTAWDRGRLAKEVLAEFDNVEFVDQLDPTRPIVVIGNADPRAELPLFVTWEGWSGGVVAAASQRMDEKTEFVIAGVLGGAFAVSEAFQWTRGYPVAAARNVGLSLWSPDRDWRHPDAIGPALAYLPDNYWLLGLGHLGQAFAWTLGFLPFPEGQRDRVRVMLQDIDRIVDANESTSMLVRKHARGLKTHVVAAQLNELGLTALITDRRFDEHVRLNAEQPAEPRLALAGFDKTAPRRQLEEPGFSYVVDAGIGVGPVEYLGISIRTFPSSRTAEEVFGEESDAQSQEDLLDNDAYRAAAEDAIRRGDASNLEAARCGLLDIAGRAAGAAFVGSIAAVAGISELLRIVNGGDQYETVALNLRTPESISAYCNPVQQPVRNPGFVPVETTEVPGRGRCHSPS